MKNISRSTLSERIKKEAHKPLLREDFDELKVLPITSNKEVAFEPEVKNLASSRYDEYVQKMKRAISEYNRLVYLKKLDEAMKVAEKIFPKSEIDFIKTHGHSIILGYQIKEETVQVKKPVYKKVTKVFVNETKVLYNLMYEDGTKIQTTWNHPFSIIDKGWVEAKNLKVGDFSKTTNGKLKLIAINIEHLKEPVKVYNFEVEGSHTYFVTAAGILVHNYGGEEFISDLKNKGAEVAAKNLEEATKNKIEGKGFYTNEELKEKQYLEIKNKVISESGIDAVNGALEYKRKNPNMVWGFDGKGENGTLDCNNLISRSFQEAGFDKNNTYLGPYGFSASKQYRIVDTSKETIMAGDVKVYLDGGSTHVYMLTGKSSKEAVIESTPRMIVNPDGTVIDLPSIRIGKDYLDNQGSKNRDVKVYRRLISKEYFQKKSGNTYSEENWERFKKENPNNYFDRSEYEEDLDSNGQFVKKNK